MKDIFDVIANGNTEDLVDFNTHEINQTNKKGITPLMVVSQKGNFEDYINYAFIMSGNREISEIFLQDSSVSIDSTNEKGSYNALSMAVGNNNIEQVKLLIEYGADSDIFYDDERPVNIAAARGYKEILCLLVDSGASLEPVVTAEGSIYDGPLVYAVCSEKSEMVELLVSLGARVDARHEDNQTALMVAEEKGFADIAELLKSLM
ncbi:MAG TPA: ankyrin repeat domain-containing protein [Spirochaetota bacterium]|nr:ankyrin repeat domain-containing protein [Spirochaetota bacterium]